jgi:hypothetical protein
MTDFISLYLDYSLGYKALAKSVLQHENGVTKACLVLHEGTYRIAKDQVCYYFLAKLHHATSLLLS